MTCPRWQMREAVSRLKFPLVQVQGMSFQVVGKWDLCGILKVKKRTNSEVWELERSWEMPHLLLEETH